MATVPMCVSAVRALSFQHFNSLFRPSASFKPRSCNMKTFSSASPASSTSEAAKPTEETQKDDTDHRLENLEKEKAALAEKVTDLDDKYKRALAESENVRQRMQRQIADTKLFGIQGFCKDLLEVADVLQRATETVPADQLRNQHNPHLKSLYDGLCMTETQLQKVFRAHGLKQINPIGEKFNPNMHEALFEQAVEGKEPGTVAIVTKVGYALHERTIRPALVGVVKAPHNS